MTLQGLVSPTGIPSQYSHDAISILNKVFAAVLAPTEAVPPHDHVHELVVHQLSDIVDVHHGRNLCAASGSASMSKSGE